MITTPPPPDPPVTLLFDLLRQYAERQGWIPIGYRTFPIGPWTVTVNGTREIIRGFVYDLEPGGALIVHRDVAALIYCSPVSGGSMGGWAGAEDAFIQDLEKVLAEGTAES